MDFIQEFTYKAAINRAEVIDKTLWAILKTRRPRTYALLNTLRWRWLWKLAGIHMTERFESPHYSEYSVYQHDDLLATFEVKQDLQA